jgi:hypothetical protein
MKLLATVLMSACLAVAGNAVAQDKKAADKPMAMTMKECQDYTDMAKKDATKKDAKKDAACADMMKKADPAKAAAPKEAPKK